MIFGKNFIEHKTYVLIHSTVLCKISLTQKGMERDIIIKVPTSSCKVPDILA